MLGVAQHRALSDQHAPQAVALSETLCTIVEFT